MEDSGDEETGEDEKQIDATPSGMEDADDFAEAGDSGADVGEVVVEEHHGDGGAAEPVEGVDVGTRRGAGGGGLIGQEAARFIGGGGHQILGETTCL